MMTKAFFIKENRTLYIKLRNSKVDSTDWLKDKYFIGRDKRGNIVDIIIKNLDEVTMANEDTVLNILDGFND